MVAVAELIITFHALIGAKSDPTAQIQFNKHAKPIDRTMLGTMFSE